MADVVYNLAKKTNIDWATADIRALLLGGASVPAGARDPDLTNVAALLAVSGTTEVNATNYVRKTTTRTDTANNTDNRGDQAISAAITWSAIGGALNDTIRAVVFYVYNASDASAVPYSYHDLSTPVPTNGSDFTINAGDIVRTA
jgi:hypothetical protein